MRAVAPTALSLLLSGHASAATYHVATTGHDALGDGSPGAPFRTIQRGLLSATQAGDRVVVHAGTYTPTDGLWFPAGHSGSIVANNVFVQTGARPLTWVSEPGDGVSYHHNLWFGGAPQSRPSGSGDVHADPLFVDAAACDFVLTPVSPCIDAGDADALPAGVVRDFAGATRRVNDWLVVDTGVGSPPAIDLGAHESPIDPSRHFDLNADGAIDVDVVYGATNAAEDVNGDGVANDADASSVREHVRSGETDDVVGPG